MSPAIQAQEFISPRTPSRPPHIAWRPAGLSSCPLNERALRKAFKAKGPQIMPTNGSIAQQPRLKARRDWVIITTRLGGREPRPDASSPFESLFCFTMPPRC